MGRSWQTARQEHGHQHGKNMAISWQTHGYRMANAWPNARQNNAKSHGKSHGQDHGQYVARTRPNAWQP
eukprot:11200658-Lingulodinium_polyedra.AAC.1